MTTPVILPENVTNIDSLAVWSNNAVEGWFGTGVLVMIWWFFLTQFSFDDNVKAFMVASFLTSIFSVILLVVGIISQYVVYVFFAMTVASFIYWQIS